MTRNLNSSDGAKWHAKHARNHTCRIMSPGLAAALQIKLKRRKNAKK